MGRHRTAGQVGRQVTCPGVGLPVPWKPNSVDPPDPSPPFHAAGVNVTGDIDDAVLLHAWAT